LSANQCMRKRNLPEWISGRKEAGSKAEEGEGEEGATVPVTNGRGGKAGRRSSSITTRTEEGHEICWPAKSPGADSTTTTKTDENHEIQWPTPNKSAPPRDPPAPVNGVEVHPALTKKTSSPLKQSVSAIAEDKEEGGEAGDEFVSRGGSCIVGPLGEVLAGPLWEVEDGGLLVADVDMDDCVRAKLDFDAVGSYSRDDAFRLSVEGLDLNPPV